MSTVELAQALWLLLAALGLALSVSYAGLPVLAQGAFVAVGGVGTALLGPGGAGLPLGLAVLVAVLAGGALGLLVALVAARLNGAYLALATWALAWLVHEALLAFPDVFGGAQGLVRRAPAHLVSPLLGLDLVLTPVVHVALAAGLCLAVVAALRRLDRGPGGLDLLALRQGPELAGSLGIPVAARRRTVLSATACLGALSGAGSTVLLGLVAPADVSPLLSVQLFVAVLLGGAASWWGPVVGVALLTALPSLAGLLPFNTERSRGLLTALLLVGVLLVRRLPRRPAADRPTPPEVGGAEPVPAAASGGTALLAAGLRVRFGSVLALDGVGLELRAGEIHALIGPNGSGKSTLLRVLAGELEPADGVVSVAGKPQPRRASPVDRVRLGVVRTTQRATVLQADATRQVLLGDRGGATRPQAVLRHLLATPAAARAERAAAQEVGSALSTTELAPRATTPPDRLTAAERSRLQIARALATGASALLLDEPAAGLSVGERVRLARVLRRLAGNGVAVLLVEHDMRLVSAVADRVTVLEAGRVLASGRPDEVRADPAVRRAYLGPVTA